MSQGPQQGGPQQQPGQWRPVNPPAPPVSPRNWFMRHKIFTGLIGLVVLVGAFSALGGGGDTPSALPDPPSTSTSPRTGAVTAATPKVDPDDVGNEANPVTIVEGKAFSIRKFDYAAGWSIKDSDFGMELTNLKVTNNRDRRDGAFVQIKFMKGSEVLASIDCTSDQILQGQTVSLNCFATGKKPATFEKITINDAF